MGTDGPAYLSDGTFDNGGIGSYCKDCINCRETWSAGGDLSCHDTCDKFKQWKEEGEGILSESKNHE
jgi:hypothetical protein